MAITAQSNNRVSNELEDLNKLVHEAIDSMFINASEAPFNTTMSNIRVSISRDKHREPTAAHASCKITMHICGHSRNTGLPPQPEL